jgi:GTP pyrophosphokinase
VEIATKVPPEIESALHAARERLLARDAVGTSLDRGMRIARVCAELSGQQDLSLAALAREALRERAALADHLAQDLGADIATAALALSQLGDFKLATDWRPDQRLGGGQAETLRRMLLASAQDPRLIVARLAAVLVDLRDAKSLDASARQSLALAARVVYGPLANRLGIWQVKWELEDLAFRYLEPADYQRIATALAERRLDRESYIALLVTELKSALANAGVDAQVYGRPKHIFSIWRKMQRKQLAFEQIFDVRALRIVCRSTADCYAALGVVHGRYAFIPGEFDDYIATPKENDYRSIHTAVIGPQDRAVEIQIRTDEMHAQAELGLAAHWRYKEGGSRDQRNERRIEWMRGLLGTGAAPAADDGDYLDQVRGELFADRVYALTPKGEVVDLPAKATPLDFAYQVHTGLGHRCRGAKINGRIVPLPTPLTSGEVVEIITGKEESPSRDWLIEDEGFLVSPRSRAKVRAWFRKLDASDNIAAGRQMADRELHQLGAGADLLAALVGDLKSDNLEQMYRLLGEGELSLRQLSQAAGRRLGNVRSAPKPAPRKPAKRSQNPIEVEGIGDLPVTLARCCAPMRPEAIVGYVTLGRGLTVHAAGCKSFFRMRASHPERGVPVRWRVNASALLTVELTVNGFDRRGLVRDLSEVIAAENLSIEAMNTSTDRSAGTARTVLRFGVLDQTQLARLQRNLQRVPNVTQVRRSN